MKRLKLFAVLAAFALVVTACGSDDEADDTTTTTAGDAATTTAAPVATTEAPGAMAGQGGKLLLLQWQAVSQNNSYLSNGTKDIQGGSLVLEPLAEFDPDGNVVPALAAEIPTEANGGISADKTQITWKLQPGIVWSDGTPLTSADVVFSYDYCADELTGCTQDVFVGVTSVEAVDELTVTITFDEPQPYPFVPFAGATSPVLQKAQMEPCMGEAAKTCTEQNFKPIGTGPFMVTELRAEDTAIYEYNPNYRGAAEGKPFFGEVEIKGGGDAEATARSVLEIGEADYAWNLQVAPEILLPMEAAGNGTIKVAFASAVEHINLNQTDPDGDPPSEYAGGENPYFYQNEILHDALSLAINRDEIVAVAYGPSGKPTCNIWPVGSQNSPNTADVCTQDVAKANQLLDDAGWVDSDGDGVRETPDGLPLEFDYITSTNAVRQSTQALVKDYWEDIGVATNMLNADASLFFDGTCASDDCIWKFFKDIQMYTNSSTGPDVQGYLQGWLSTDIPTADQAWGGGNLVRLRDEQFDTLFAELAVTPLDDPNRDAIAIQLNDIIVSYSTIPLVARGDTSAVANDIQGVGDLNGWDTEFWNIEEWTRAG